MRKLHTRLWFAWQAVVATPSAIDLPEGLRESSSAAGCAGGRRLADVERDHIVRTLRDVVGNKAAAARVLGLDRKTLYRKLIQHRIATRHEP